MESDWAVEHLQVIRTFMERAAVYRRALSPIMLSLGALGLAAAAAGLAWHLNSLMTFAGLWFGTALVGIVIAFLIARRQAFKAREPFWSAPTRRAAHAILPALTAGLCVSFLLLPANHQPGEAWILALVWMLFYGCALNAVGFFMRRGIKLFGWIFIGCAAALAVYLRFRSGAAGLPQNTMPHWIMGFFFGLCHLAYGFYLRFTEKGTNAA